MAVNYTPQTFAVAVLQRLHAPVTHANVQAMVGWQNAEGGNWHNDARYNPLNTTQNAPGAGNTGSQGNIKVYKNWQQGLDATVQTLENGRYGGIIHALKTGTDANAVGSAITASPWGTGGLAAQVIAHTKIGSLPTPAPLKATPRAATTTTTTTTPAAGLSDPRKLAAIALLLGSQGQYGQNALPLSLLQQQGQQAPTTVKTTKIAPTKAPTGSNTGGSVANGTVQFANSRIGHYAENLGSNRGTQLDGLEKKVGLSGEAWCSIFATTAVVHGGAGTQARTASVRQLSDWAQAGTNGYQKGIRSTASARAGDLVVRGTEHVGVVAGRTSDGKIIVIEGNANGSGGVVKRTYSPGAWTGVVRPK